VKDQAGLGAHHRSSQLILGFKQLTVKGPSARRVNVSSSLEATSSYS